MLRLESSAMTPVQTLGLMKSSCDSRGLCLTPDMHYFVIERRGIREYQHMDACVRYSNRLANRHFRHKHERADHFRRRIKRGFESLVHCGLVPHEMLDFIGEQGAEVWFDVSSTKNSAYCRVAFAMDSLNKDMVLGAVLLAEALDDMIINTIKYLDRTLSEVLDQVQLGIRNGESN